MKVDRLEHGIQSTLVAEATRALHNPTSLQSPPCACVFSTRLRYQGKSDGTGRGLCVKASESFSTMYRPCLRSRAQSVEAYSEREDSRERQLPTLSDTTPPFTARGDVLHAGLKPPRSFSDKRLKRTTFSSPQAASACMPRVHGSDRALPYSLGPDRRPQTQLLTHARASNATPHGCSTRVVHHHSSVARRCTASGDLGAPPPS